MGTSADASVSPFRTSLLAVLVADAVALLLWFAWSRPGPSGFGRLGPVLVAAVPIAALAALRALPRRLALRTMRREGRALLPVVLSAALCVAVSTAAFICAQSLRRAQHDIVGEILGPVDLLVSADTPAIRSAAQQRITDAIAANGNATASPLGRLIDGQLPLVVAEGKVALVANGSPVRSAAAHVIELDPKAAQAFGSVEGVARLDETGFKGHDVIAPSSALVGRDLASLLGINAGSPIELTVGTQILSLEAAAVLPRQGLAAISTDGSLQPLVVFVPPGYLTASLAEADSAASSLRYLLALSTTGDANRSRNTALAGAEAVAATFEGTVATTDFAEASEAGVRASVSPVKLQVSSTAERIAAPLQRLLRGLSLLLLFAAVANLGRAALTLGARQRREVASMRSLGFERLDLVCFAGVQAALVAAVASAVGSVLGFVFTRAVFSSSAVPSSLGVFAKDSLRVPFRAGSLPLFSGFSLGFALVTLVLLATTFVALRRPIRSGFQNPENFAHRQWQWVAFALVPVFGLGVGSTILGLRRSDSFLFLSGLGCILLALSAALWWKWPDRTLFAKALLAVTIVGSIGPRFWPSMFRESGERTFVAHLALLATLLCVLSVLSFAARRPSTSSGSAPAVASTGDAATTSDYVPHNVSAGERNLSALLVRAHLREHGSRTFLTLLGVALLIGTLTALLMLTGSMRASQSSRIGSANASWRYVVALAEPGAVTSTVARLSGQGSVATVATNPIEVTADSRTVARRLAVVTSDLLAGGVLPLREKQEGITDEAVFKTMIDQAGVVVVDQDLLLDGGPLARRVSIGDVLALNEPRTGRSVTVTVIGVAASTDGFAPVIMGPATMTSLFPEGLRVDRLLVGNSPGSTVARLSDVVAELGPDGTAAARGEIAAATRSAAAQVVGLLRNLALLLLFISGGLVFSAQRRVLLERRNEHRTVESLGGQRRLLIRTSVAEMLSTVGVGALIGYVAGVIATWRYIWGGAVGPNVATAGFVRAAVAVLVFLAIGIGVVIWRTFGLRLNAAASPVAQVAKRITGDDEPFVPSL